MATGLVAQDGMPGRIQVGNIVEASTDRQEFEKRLFAFEGMGPKTVEIFMREVGTVIF